MKKFVLILVAILTLVAIPITVFVVGQRQELRQKAAPATTLSFTPATITKAVGDTFSLEATIDTAANQVVAAELHVLYDPAKLEAQTITNGALFPSILASGVVGQGTASITVGARDSTHPVTGRGTSAVIKFKALAKTDAPISVKFAATTFVGGLGEGATNILVGSTPATVTITDTGTAGANSTTTIPTPTLTVNLTPAPTIAASKSGTASSSATQVTSPKKDTEVSTNKPVIQGKAAPGATVTITIYSTPQTAVVTADANGNWTYTPTTPLDPGPHNVVITAQSATETTTATSSFVVAAASETSQSTVATGSAMPVSGSTTTTVFLLVIGCILILGGMSLPIMIR